MSLVPAWATQWRESVSKASLQLETNTLKIATTERLLGIKAYFYVYHLVITIVLLSIFLCVLFSFFLSFSIVLDVVPYPFICVIK